MGEYNNSIVFNTHITESNTMTTFTEDTIVAQLDLDDPWFLTDDTDRIELPGENRNPISENVVSRRQARTIFMAIQSLGLDSLPLAEAVDKLRGPSHARMTPRQYDIQLVTYSISKMRSANANDPITEDQAAMIATNMAALMGTTPHWSDTVNANIGRMAEQHKMMFVNQLMSVATKGQLDTVMIKLRAFIGDPAAESAANRTAAAKQAVTEAQMAEAGVEPF